MNDPTDPESIEDVTHVVLRKELSHGVLVTFEVPVETNQHKWIEAMGDLRRLTTDPGQIAELKTALYAQYMRQLHA